MLIVILSKFSRISIILELLSVLGSKVTYRALARRDHDAKPSATTQNLSPMPTNERAFEKALAAQELEELEKFQWVRCDDVEWGECKKLKKFPAAEASQGSLFLYVNPQRKDLVQYVDDSVVAFPQVAQEEAAEEEDRKDTVKAGKKNTKDTVKGGKVGKTTNVKVEKKKTTNAKVEKKKTTNAKVGKKAVENVKKGKQENTKGKKEVCVKIQKGKKEVCVKIQKGKKVEVKEPKVSKAKSRPCSG
jgi:hypothetical protein